MGAHSTVGTPRRYEALAYIIERIVQTGTSPSYDEIGRRLSVSKTRARELVDELIAEGEVERPPGRQRTFVLRDMTHSRAIVVNVLKAIGWIEAAPIQKTDPPRTFEQLSVLPPFEHLEEDS